MILYINIPVMIMMILYSIISIRAIRNEYISDIRTRQESIIRIIETDTDYVENQLFFICNLDEWVALSGSSRSTLDYSDVQIINSLRSMYKNILGTSRFYSDVASNMQEAGLRISFIDGVDDFSDEEYSLLLLSKDGRGLKFFNGRYYISAKNIWNTNIHVETAACLDPALISSFIRTEGILGGEKIIIDFSLGEDDEYLFVNVPDSEIEKCRNSIKDQSNDLVVQAHSDNMGFTIYSIIDPKEMYGSLSVYFWILLVIVVCSVGTIILYTVVVRKMLNTPVKKLLDGFAALEHGDFDMSLTQDREDEFQLIYQRFNQMSSRLNKLIEDNYVMELYTKEAEYKQLQTQINPHFLYNSLFVLQNMILDEDTENASAFSKELGNFYRYITKTSDQIVPLSSEIDHTENYLEIMKRRYEHRLNYKVKLEEDAGRTMVPKLIIQPFIENVFIHGFGDTESLYIEVSAFLDGNTVHVSIKDNGIGITDEEMEKLKRMMADPKMSGESAMVNVHRRIQISSGDAYGVNLYQNVPSGLYVEITVKA